LSETGSALRATSDALLRDLERLAALEQEKRELSPDDPRMVEVAAQVESLALAVLGSTVRQRELTERVTTPVARAPGGPAESIAATPREIHVILAGWRDAERRASEAIPGSADAANAELEIDNLREEYRRAHEEAIRRRGP
jgi:hypothetical protein